MKKMNMLAAATATAIAVMGSGTASAVTMGEANDVLLVPYVYCDLNAGINTMVGLTTIAADRQGSPARLSSKDQGTVRNIHWRFYDERSVHRLDAVIPATDNDFVRVDWCDVVRSTGRLDRVKGYLLFHDDGVRIAWPGGDYYKLHGHSYQVRGNWASQAFMPVMTESWGNVSISGGYPRIDFLSGGTLFDQAGAYRHIALRYFLDPALSTGSDFVFWFNRNNSDRGRTPVEVFDSEQVYLFSDNANLGNELNVIESTPTNPAFAGMNLGFDGDAVNTGFVNFYVPGTASTTTTVHSGIAFGMVRLGAGSNPDQIQTELALEGPWLSGPF